MEKRTTLNSYNVIPRKGISWRAIFAGTITVLAVMLLLNLIGLAIGFGSIEPTEENSPLSGLGTGSIIWWVLSSLIALFLGGFVAARVGVSFTNKSGIIQGIMTWALYTFISAWLVTSAVSSIVTGVGNLVGNVISTTGQAVGDPLKSVIDKQSEKLDISLEDAKEQFYALLEDSGKEELDPDRIDQSLEETTTEAREQVEDAARGPGSANAEIEEIFSAAKDNFEGSYEALDKEALVNILVERTDMSEMEAEQTVEDYLAQYENLREEADEFLERAKEEANQQAENISKAVADAALYLSIALILGAIVAAVGGFLGAKNLRDDYSQTYYVSREKGEINEDYEL